MPTATTHAIDPTVIARFWAKVKRDSASGCWRWTASTIRGYGQFRLPRQHGSPPLGYAHRVAWLITYGYLPDTLDVCHHCDTPLCVNPAHLFLGTARENLQDASRKGRLAVPRTKKLTQAQRLVIAAVPRQRGTGRLLARLYGVSETAISLTRRGRFIGALEPVEAGAQLGHGLNHRHHQLRESH